MIGTKFTANIIQDQKGNKDIQVEISPLDSAVTVYVVLNPAGARNIARILTDAADKAERVIVMPSFDGVPPVKA